MMAFGSHDCIFTGGLKKQRSYGVLLLSMLAETSAGCLEKTCLLQNSILKEDPLACTIKLFEDH